MSFATWEKKPPWYLFFLIAAFLLLFDWMLFWGRINGILKCWGEGSFGNSLAAFRCGGDCLCIQSAVIFQDVKAQMYLLFDLQLLRMQNYVYGFIGFYFFIATQNSPLWDCPSLCTVKLHYAFKWQKVDFSVTLASVVWLLFLSKSQFTELCPRFHPTCPSSCLLEVLSLAWKCLPVLFLLLVFF